MFQDFPDNNKDDEFLNEFRQRLANQSNMRMEEKQKDMQRSRSVFLGAVAGVGLACVVGWFALAPKNNSINEKDLPVIRRPQTAVKMRPAEPGGMEILNQDKTVYNIIDKSSEGGKVEQLLPPPEEPKLPEITPESTTIVTETDTTISDVIDNIDNGEKTIEEVKETKAVVEEKAEDKTVSIAEVSQTTTKVEEVKTEPVKEEPKQAVETPKADNSQPSSAPAGSWQIQLMSSKNKTAIESSWKALVKKHPVLVDLPYEIESADIDFSGTFYRLKAGAFANKADADTVCNTLKSQGGSCIVKKK